MKHKHLTFLLAVLMSMVASVASADTREYVDLGLPSGTLWATCNVGADSPEDYGLYFAWGETTGYTGDTSDGRSFDWSTYKYCNGSYSTLTKYCNNSSYGYNGFTDDLTELVPEDDAATANWGANWRMPSLEQFDELINSSYTTTEWTTVNGVYGRKITSKVSGHVGNFIFLPAAGYRNNSSLYLAGSSGLYWSRTLYAGGPNGARYLYFNSSSIYTSSNSLRYLGLSVRPVRSTLLDYGQDGVNPPSETNPCNATSLIKNAAFYEGTQWQQPPYWTVEAMGQNNCWQNNNTFQGVDGAFLDQFMESWISGTLNDGAMYQTLESLPSGIYEIGVDAMTNGQGTTKTTATGVELFATGGDITTTFPVATDNNTPEHFTLTFVSTGGDVTLGLRTRSTNIGWLCADNFTLTYYGNSTIALSPSSLSLAVGSSMQLVATVTPVAAAATALTWSSSNTEVAVVGSDGVVLAVAPGTCTITCETTDGSNVSATCEVTVIPAAEKEYVDLGLPSGTLWATCNIGADSPEDYGLYFAWGETTGYTQDTPDGHSFGWASYKYCNGSYSTLTKYCNDSNYGNNGFTDNLTELVPGDDAATANWGANWRMPSLEQFDELKNSSYTTTEWTTVNGVYGYKITSKMSGHVGNFIFLPAAGYRDSWFLIAGSLGFYWSRTLDAGGPVGARYLNFDSSVINTGDYYGRYIGFSVRPVRVSPTATGITLSSSSLSLTTGSYAQLTTTVTPAAAAATALTWSSSDTDVALVGSDGVVVAIAPGTCTITCETTDGSNVSATCEVTVIQTTEKEYVDLGLPSGTLWATCNIGADSPEDHGLYFAWGETVPDGGTDDSNAMNYSYAGTYTKTFYAWSTYKYCNGSNTTLTKYCTDSSYGYNGFTDNLTELLPEDDAATVNWGSGWRMPSQAQFEELINSSYTTTEWTTVNGVYGRKITSKVSGYVGNFIFLSGDLSNFAGIGVYWSRTLSTSNPDCAPGLVLHASDIHSRNSYFRYDGHFVRPVRIPVATSIALSPSSLSLAAGSSTQFTATVSPAAAAMALTWSSSNTEVAVVSSEGMVVAVGPGTCTITCETTDGSNVSATCEVTVTTAFVNNVNFIDGGAYDNGFAQEVGTITYTRNFTNTGWQALYVPFEMQYEDWKDDFEVARINNVNQYDDDEDGNVDRTVLEMFKVKSGHTEAHTPYLIKAKTTGEKTISLTNTTLYKAEEKSYDVSSWNTLYTFTGTYTGVSGATMFGEGYYALGNGSLHQAADATNSLSPMRWYMAVTDRDGNPKNVGEVKVVVFGMDEDELIETGLEEVGRDAISTNEQPVFDLNGRRVTNPRKGLYIKNGKKFVVK